MLRRYVIADLSRFLLAHAERYGVTMLEAQRLHVHIAALEKAPAIEPGAGSAPPKPLGASGGGVILAPGKDEPRRHPFDRRAGLETRCKPPLSRSPAPPFAGSPIG